MPSSLHWAVGGCVAAVLLATAGYAASIAGGPVSGASSLGGPSIRPGRWRQTYPAGEGAVICLSGRRPILARLPKACGQASIRSVPHGFAVDAACAARGAAMSFHGVVTGDFQQSYEADMALTIQPPGAAAIVQREHSAYAYAGPCGPHEIPDDQ